MRNILGIIFIFFGMITLFMTNAPLWNGVRDIVIGYLLIGNDKEA